MKKIIQESIFKYIQGVIKKYHDWFYLPTNSKLTNLQFFSCKIVPVCCYRYTLPPALLQLLKSTLEIIFSQHLSSIAAFCFTASAIRNDLPFSSYLTTEIKKIKGNPIWRFLRMLKPSNYLLCQKTMNKKCLVSRSFLVICGSVRTFETNLAETHLIPEFSILIDWTYPKLKFQPSTSLNGCFTVFMQSNTHLFSIFISFACLRSSYSLRAFKTFTSILKPYIAYHS